MKKVYLFCLLSLLVIFGCAEKEDSRPTEPTASLNRASCVGCHTDYLHLKEIYTPDPPDAGGGGCGGDAPHIEPYDRVFLGGSGFEDFKNDIHGKIPCESCHGGIANTSDKKLAHSGNFVKKPSENPEVACGRCHPNIVNQTKNSLHQQGWGQKNMVTLRSGTGNIPAGFNALSEQMKKGYDKNCAKCHATCGDCHVMRPKAGGGGLYKGHKFVKTPDMVDHCTTCHSSRGGHAYFGVAPGTVPDVHLTKRGFTCMNCHTKNEIHGDGKIYDMRYKMPELPECTDCHSGINNSNIFHSTHINTFSCNVCHSQNYNNCGSCHVGGEGARIPSYISYKIGMNPIPNVKPKYKYALLRRSPMAPDSWKEYGTSILSNFNVAPTYKYATPHNIVKITPRTGFKNASGQWVPFSTCTEGCHIIKNPDGTFKNKELYLFNSDCLDWEKPANINVIVDGKLPPNWQVN